MTATTGALALSFGLRFHELYDLEGLSRIDAQFRSFLEDVEAGLSRRLTNARADAAMDRKAESELMVELAPHVEDFLAILFGIAPQVRDLQARHHELAPLYSVKRLFVQRRAVKGKSIDDALRCDGNQLERDLVALFNEPFSELVYARLVSAWLADEKRYAAQLEVAASYALWAVMSPAGQARHSDGVLFKVPHKINPDHLVLLESVQRDDICTFVGPSARQRHRSAFHLTDSGAALSGALDEANYCIWCHNQGKDSCSKGLRDKKSGEFERTPAGVALAGCPLDERISEMNLVKSRGYSLGALAIVTVDNPICAATGHRICNDCMKACIYQKQEPVNIPQIETRTLKDILSLPWGFEIYSLLTRWNPLNLKRPLPKPPSGYKILVAGLGPAGFTLAHHLMNDGHSVFAIDGLKLEPLPKHISGVDAAGNRVAFQPIENLSEIFEDLNDRTMAGFGGVAEYGITVRWDKNFLKVVRLLLERRERFAMYGGVRFGGPLTVDDAFAKGFDHIALCLGAGKPTFVGMQNGLAPGVRQASDFLMALQLTGAAKSESIANLTVRLPIVVIGGGLTAIDTATEALAYYPVQVEKFLSRYESLGAAGFNWTDQEKSIADEFLEHARALRVERALAKEEGRQPRISEILSSWGGATVVYRRKLAEAPSYTLSFFGDLHPSFAGNVVKAMASATRGYPVVSSVLRRRDPTPISDNTLRDELNRDLRPTIFAVNRLTPTIVEVVLRAPQAAQKFKPGQFFRLQNYESLSKKAFDTRLTMEGLALTGAWVDSNAGLVSTIVLEMGGSSSLCKLLEPNEPVVLMGPTGEPTEIHANQTYILVGGGLGNAVLFSIGQEARSKNSKVLYFAGYKSMSDRYMVEQIERAADTVIWCCDETPGFVPTRSQDRAFVGNIVEAIQAYGEGRLGQPLIPLSDADRLVVIGSDQMMAAVARARHTSLLNFLNKSHIAIGSINSPMQCMMKEICGQCLQVQRDPDSNEEKIVFSCLNQDQLLDHVDFSVLRDRLSQNGAQERLTGCWIRKCLSEEPGHTLQ